MCSIVNEEEMCSIFDEEETQIEIHVEHDDKLNDKLEVDEGFELEQEPEEVGWLDTDMRP